MKMGPHQGNRKEKEDHGNSRQKGKMKSQPARIANGSKLLPRPWALEKVTKR